MMSTFCEVQTQKIERIVDQTLQRNSAVAEDGSKRKSTRSKRHRGKKLTVKTAWGSMSSDTASSGASSPNYSVATFGNASISAYCNDQAFLLPASPERCPDPPSYARILAAGLRRGATTLSAGRVAVTAIDPGPHGTQIVGKRK